MTAIELPERGSLDLDARRSNELPGDPAFRALLEAQIVSARFLPDGRVRLSANGFIGEANIGNIRLRLVEKAAGAAELLLSLAGDESFRFRDQERLTTAPGELLRLVIARFAQLVSTYCSSGRDFKYRNRTVISPQLAGRLLIAQTVKLRASGKLLHVACEKSDSSFDTPFNAAIYAGLRQAERLSHAAKASSGTIMAVRAMASIFQHISEVEVHCSREGRMRTIKELIVLEREPFRSTLLRTASLLLSGEGIERSNYRDGVSPITWFIALHGLFEEAIFRGLRKATGPWATVSRGVSPGGPVFLLDNSLFRLKPDLVIAPTVGDVFVGDVKYKNLDGGGKPAEQDIYQLVTHATAFKAKTAFLVYPGDAFQHNELGATVGGLKISVFTVPLSGFQDHVVALVECLKKIAAKTSVAHFSGASSS